MKNKLTRVIEKRGKWYIAWVKEIPGMNTQGRTKKLAHRNLKDALARVVQVNRELATRRRLRPDL